MERELSARQRRFAAEIAAGQSRAKAYAIAYPNQRMKKSSLEVVSKKAAKHPKVKAEIERLLIQLLPPVQDMRAAYEHAFATVIKLSIESRDDRVRFDCARWLRAECERQERLLAAVRPEPEAERMLAGLRALYARIEAGRSATGQAPLVIAGDAADADGDGATAEPPTTAVDAVEVHVEAGESQRPDECSDAEESSAPPEFRRVPVPGHYPPKFKTIRTR
jgi:hypothetical protein